MRLFLAALAVAFACAPAFAHSWYSDSKDPVNGTPCCGGHDCAPFPFVVGKNIFPTNEGYRIVLTVEEAKTINPYSTEPIDAVVIWERVQDSIDGQFHICISPNFRLTPTFGIYCFFAPPNT